MILYSCCSVSYFLSLFVCYLFKNILSLQFKMTSSSLSFQLVFQIFSLDLNAISWSQWHSISLSDFVIHVSVNLIIFLNHICNLLKMMLFSWFCFLCYFMQTVSLTTVVFSYSDSYWCNVSNTFSLSNSFIHSVHSSVNNMLSTSFFLFQVLWWVFLKIYL